MLIDTKGREFNPADLPRNKAQREVVLARLREVPPAFKPHGGMFKIEQRARLKGGL